MVELTARAERRDGVTLVEGRLRHEGADSRRVRIENALDGPVWPPRRESVPAEGWDLEAGTLTLSLRPGDRRGFGFATPARPEDPPVAVVASEPVDPEGGIGDTPAAVVRALGDPSPPVDAVPPACDRSEYPSKGRAKADETSEASGDPDPTETDASPRRTSDEVPPGEAGAGGFPAVTAWLGAVERRIERAEGGEETAPGPTRVAADADRLRSVARRAVALAERADSVPGIHAEERP